MKPKGVAKTYTQTGVITPDLIQVGERRTKTFNYTSKSAIALLQLRKIAVDMRLKGMTYEDIGIEMGYSTARARTLIVEDMEYRQNELGESLELVRQMESQRLDILYGHAIEPLTAPSTFVPHPMTGQMQELKPDKNEAIKTALKVMERRATLEGLNKEGKYSGENGGAPVRVYIGIDVKDV